MPTSLILIIVFTVSIGGAWYALWKYRNSANYHRRIKAEQNRAKDARVTDEAVLSKQEKKILRRALEMASKGNPRMAAQLLDQSGLRRQCIELLEKSGMVDEAAEMLLKIQRPNRAGFIYARNGKWLKAAKCFQIANMHADAAKCLCEIQRYEDAADLFLSAGKDEEAAACYSLLNRWHDAGVIFLRLGFLEQAKTAYRSLFANDEKYGDIDFSRQELNFFQDLIAAGESSAAMIESFSKRGNAAELIRTMLKSGKILEAAMIYAHSSSTTGSILISEVNLQSSEGRNLARMFQHLKSHRYAGMVLEQIGDFMQAAFSFEQEGDIERASYCYERGGDILKAKRLKESMKADSSSSQLSFRNESHGSMQEEQKFSFSEKNFDATVAVNGSKDIAAPDSFPTKEPPKSEPIQSLKGSAAPSAGVFAFGPDTKAGMSKVSNDQELFFKCHIFEGLDLSQRRQIWDLGKVIESKPSDVVVDWSSEPLGFYFLLDGEMECFLNSPAGEIQLDTLFAGDTFGEIWLLAEKPANVRLVCKAPSRLLLIKRDLFLGVLDRDASISRKVYKHFTESLLSKLLNPSKSQDIRRAS